MLYIHSLGEARILIPVALRALTSVGLTSNMPLPNATLALSRNELFGHFRYFSDSLLFQN